MKFTFLGSGSSAGIPVVGCECSVCQSENPKNTRLRPSALLTVGSKRILIDASPDFRLQALRHSIKKIDGILLSHTHFDHIGGLDDLRPLFFLEKQPFPCLGSQETLDDLKTRLPYLFLPQKEEANSTVRFECVYLPHDRGQTSFLDIPLTYFSYFQGSMKVTGFRFGNLAYIPDIRTYPLTLFDDLKGISTLVISGLRMRPSRFHFSLEEASQFLEKTGASKGYIMHICHELDHDEGQAFLPPHIQLSYDGLEIDFNL